MGRPGIPGCAAPPAVTGSPPRTRPCGSTAGMRTPFSTRRASPTSCAASALPRESAPRAHRPANFPGSPAAVANRPVLVLPHPPGLAVHWCPVVRRPDQRPHQNFTRQRLTIAWLPLRPIRHRRPDRAVGWFNVLSTIGRTVEYLQKIHLPWSAPIHTCHAETTLLLLLPVVAILLLGAAATAASASDPARLPAARCGTMR